MKDPSLVTPEAAVPCGGTAGAQSRSQWVWLRAPGRLHQVWRRVPGRSLRVWGRALQLSLATVLCCVACAAPPAQGPPRFEGDYPGLLRPPEVLGLDVVWRQRVTAEWDDGQGQSGSRGFEAVVQKQGPLLTMVGLSPFGSVGFAILLRGVEAELRNESGEELPFPPRFVLLDFQRVFYPWVSASGGPLSDGEHVTEVGGEEVREFWAEGRLTERRFRRLDGQPPGELVVSYTWADAESEAWVAHGGEAGVASGPESGGPAGSPWAAPSRAVLDNRWFGYELIVDTLEETLLEPPPRPEGP